MGTAVILVENLFEDMEAMYPYYRLQEAGHQVEVVGPQTGIYHGKYGYPLKADKSPADVNIDGVSALVIPGGHAPDKMRTNPAMVGIVRKAMERGILVAAICHGPQMLIEADVVRGRKATCYKAVKTDLVNAGASFEDKSVVVDGNLITSRIPSDLPDFCKALVGMLG